MARISSPLYYMPTKRFVAVQFSKRYAFMLERIWQEINISLLSFLSFVCWNDIIFSNQSFVVVYSFIDILTMLRDDSTWFTFITFLLPLLTNQDKKDNFAGKIMSISSPKQYLIDTHWMKLNTMGLIRTIYFHTMLHFLN